MTEPGSGESRLLGPACRRIDPGERKKIGHPKAGSGILQRRHPRRLLHEIRVWFGLEQADDDLAHGATADGPKVMPPVLLPMSEFGTSADSLSTH